MRLFHVSMYCVHVYISINQNRLEHELIPFMHMHVLAILSGAISTDMYRYMKVISLNAYTHNGQRTNGSVTWGIRMGL